MSLGLAFTTEQMDMLRTVAAPLEHSLRARYLARIGAALTGRDAVGDGELSRLAHAIVRELSAPREQLTKPAQEAAIRGFNIGVP
jgi:hypothetical protein